MVGTISGTLKLGGSMSSYELTDVAAPARSSVDAIRAELAQRGITEYAVVDHGHDMAAAGVTPHPAWTLVFGNPAAGEALLAADLSAAVDIPLRLAVVAVDDHHSQIVLRPMETLLDERLLPIAERLTTVLRSIASAAREAAQVA
jgi:uncharacterized protein (DUF302 family)